MKLKFRKLFLLYLLLVPVLTAFAFKVSQVVFSDYDNAVRNNAQDLLEEGREIFRYDTFGDEDYWGGQLGLHKTIAGDSLGGIGPGLSPTQALALGLKVDVEALPQEIKDGLANGSIDLNDPAITIALLQLNAVVGVKGIFNGDQLTSIGITCASCHSTVDDSFAPGIGNRLDGWANRDLNVGEIVAFAADLQPIASHLGVDTGTVKQVLKSWGPGKYDAELNIDGKAFRPDDSSAATLLPSIFGLAGVNLHTYTGWGSVTYWNAYVGVLQMHGKGTFYDPRLKDEEKFPLAAANDLWNVRSDEDLLTPKLAALHFYQLSLPAPEPPEGSYDQAAAVAGEAVFNDKGQCATCHVPPIFTEPGYSIHKAEEIGIDDFQAMRSPTEGYRTTPLKGLWTRMKGGFYHDGRFATLLDVVNHYDDNFDLNLADDEKTNLVEYLKSLGDEGFITGVETGDNNSVPDSYVLYNNYPNPFNPKTTLEYSIPRAGHVTIKVFNLLGEEVSTLVNEFKQSGKYSIGFDASSLPSGVYIYKIEADNFEAARKMVLLK